MSWGSILGEKAFFETILQFYFSIIFGLWAEKIQLSEKNIQQNFLKMQSRRSEEQFQENNCFLNKVTFHHFWNLDRTIFGNSPGKLDRLSKLNCTCRVERFSWKFFFLRKICLYIPFSEIRKGKWKLYWIKFVESFQQNFQRTYPTFPEESFQAKQVKHVFFSKKM